VTGAMQAAVRATVPAKRVAQCIPVTGDLGHVLYCAGQIQWKLEIARKDGVWLVVGP
jgi:hypothetical protein